MDNQLERIIAFIKRLLQLSIHAKPSFTITALYLISNLIN